MRLLVERVRAAEVWVGAEIVGDIGTGLLVQIGFERGDTEDLLREAAARLVSLRLFPTSSGRLGEDVRGAQGALLLVPAFVLAARTSESGRLDFSTAEPAGSARRLFEKFCAELALHLPGRVAAGRFGADMTIRARHDGPVPCFLRVAGVGDAERVK